MNRRSFLKFLGIGLVASVATRAAQARVCERQNGFLDRVYPVGSIYISISSVNPGTHLGGTWVSFGAGRTLVGVQTGDAEFGTVQATGGARAHTLTTAQMPSHNHPWNNSTGVVGSAFVNTAVYPHSDPRGAFLRNGASDGFKTAGGQGTPCNHFGINFNLNNGGFSIHNAGSGTAHNNLQPYITVFMWRRSA